MQRTYKFRLYPSKKQEENLLWTLDKCRYVYNTLLGLLNEQDVIDKQQLQGDGTDLRRLDPDLQKVYSKVLQYENYRLFSNLRSLSRLKKNGKKVGRLRFKGKGWFKTFTYNQSGFKIIRTGKRCHILHLSKIGDIPIRIHRNIVSVNNNGNADDKIKQVTIKHYASGKWYACLSVESKNKINVNVPLPKHKNIKKVGIDVGLTNYVYDSDGNKFGNPKCLKKSLNKLANEQIKLSKKKKRSQNRKKQRIKVARVHEKVTNQRTDFLHKLSRYYVNTYNFIAVEKLNVKGMIRNRHLSQSIADASWSKFVHNLDYKAGNAGGQVIKVDPKNTTQICSRCGRVVKKSLAVRIHKCVCGFVIDRDYNSALNILHKAEEQIKLKVKLKNKKIGQELPELTPVETEPLPSTSVVVKVASSVTEAGSPLR